jgi:hypothetical protein
VRFLIDQSAGRVEAMAAQCDIVGGQLLTPLSRYLPWSGAFAIDNGAFTSCDVPAFRKFVARLQPHRERCQWLAVPDVVGSARRTFEVFDALAFEFHGWPLAFVVPIPWDRIAAVFIGGGNPWKTDERVRHIIKAAQLLGKHTHAGRVNTPERFAYFDALGVDTCDGSGVSRYDHMLDAIVASRQPRPLLGAVCAGA